MTAMPAAAAFLADRGVSVFPCRADKRPATPHGFHDAVRDSAAARELWRSYPGTLVGVPTGATNRFDALDIDPRHGGDAWYAASRTRLPLTRTHETRSGGLHVLFRHAAGVRNSESKIAQGVDTRGDGGYVIWWPGTGCAVRDPGTLADWPSWLLDLLLPKAAPEPPPAQRIATAPNGGRAEAMLARALFRIETAPPGQRHFALRAAAATMGGLLDACGLSESEASRVLMDAVQRAGGADIDRSNASRTIAWGIAKGRLSPLMEGGRHV